MIMPTKYRLPDATRLGAVRLAVMDLERSLGYYREVLGFALVDRSEDAAALGAAGGGALVELRARAGTEPAPLRPRLGLYHFAVLLPSRVALGRFLAHLTSHGVRAGASDHLVSEALYLRDPDGHGIEVYADRPRAGWRYRRGEIVMETLPLDRTDLTLAGGGEPWTGMLAGTVIGHVHLHIADIEHAARFYQAALGFDVTLRSYPGALFLSAGGYHHHLGLNTWAGPDAVRPAGNEARLLEWEIVLPSTEEVDAAARSLADAGHAISGTGQGWTAEDPWGTALRVRSDGAKSRVPEARV